MSKNIIAVRHGESLHNVLNFYSATPEHSNYKESRLTELGLSQAKKTSAQLIKKGINGTDVVAVMCSPLPRAVETAQIVMSCLSIPEQLLQLDRRLIEYQVGSREGTSLDDFNDSDPWFPEKPESFGGENSYDILQRVNSAYQDALNNLSTKNGHVLMFSHGTPIFMLIEAVLGKGKGYKLPTAGHIHFPVNTAP